MASARWSTRHQISVGYLQLSMLSNNSETQRYLQPTLNWLWKEVVTIRLSQLQATHTLCRKVERRPSKFEGERINLSFTCLHFSLFFLYLCSLSCKVATQCRYLATSPLLATWNWLNWRAKTREPTESIGRHSR